MATAGDYRSFPVWPLLVEYLSLADLLTARLVCFIWKEGLTNGVSLQQCANFLEHALARQNVSILSTSNVDCYWATALHTQSSRERLQQILSINMSDNTVFETMIRILRVAQHLPQQMGVCYNSRWGRHGLAMQWNPQTNTSEPIIYNNDTCTGSDNDDGHTCLDTTAERSVNYGHTSQTPQTNDSNDYNIHDTLQLFPNSSNSHTNQPWDLSRYHHDPNIPNLPNDLLCPVCCGGTRTDGNRTLMLSEFSYKSLSNGTDDIITPLGYQASNVLTLTLMPMPMLSPNNPQEDINNGPDSDNNDVAMEDATCSSDTHSFPPPSYQELAIPDIPTTSQPPSSSLSQQMPMPLHPKPHLKHAMAIHCTKCQQFALLAPAGLCWSSRFPCRTRSKIMTMVDVPKQIPTTQTPTPTNTNATTWMGGMLVRTSCSELTCHRPVFCHECSHATQHVAYPNNSNINNTATIQDGQQQNILRAAVAAAPPRQLQHSSRCDYCKLDYCPAHSWLSTVCHHW